MTVHTRASWPGTPQRVRRMTDAEINARIDRQIERNVLFYAEHLEEIPYRLGDLDAEWDIERALEANAAVVGLAGSMLALTRGARLFALPVLVGGFLLQHATQGWCPPLPLLRRLGFRTAREIEVERNALKARRGDYANLPSGGDTVLRARAALQAAQAGPFRAAPPAAATPMAPAEPGAPSMIPNQAG